MIRPFVRTDLQVKIEKNNKNEEYQTRDPKQSIKIITKGCEQRCVIQTGDIAGTRQHTGFVI